MCLEFVFFGQGVVVVLLFGSLGIFFGVLQESNITMAVWSACYALEFVIQKESNITMAFWASLSKLFAGICCKK